jgi:hypothetical protein
MFAAGATTKFSYELPPYPDAIPSLSGWMLNWRLSSEATDAWSRQVSLLGEFGFSVSRDGSELTGDNIFSSDPSPDALGVTRARFKRLAAYFEQKDRPNGDFKIWRDLDGTDHLSLNYYLPKDSSLWHLLSAGALGNRKLELCSFGHHFADVADAPAPSVDGFLKQNQTLFLSGMPLIKFTPEIG